MLKSEILIKLLPLVFQAHAKHRNIDLDLTYNKIAVYEYRLGHIAWCVEIWDNEPELTETKFNECIANLKTLIK